MGWLKKDDPVKQELRELKRERNRLQADARFGGHKPGDEEWERASKRSAEIAKQVRNLERRR